MGNDTSPPRPPRRDLVVTAAFVFLGAGVALATWPFLSALSPGDGSEGDTTSVDLDAIAEGMTVRVAWLGRPYLVRNRTPREIAEVHRQTPSIDRYARNENGGRMDGARDEARAVQGRPAILVVSAVCTKGDCMLHDANAADGDVGWYCPCCSSRFDFSGRVLSGPAQQNLTVPRHALRDRRLVIGARTQ